MLPNPLHPAIVHLPLALAVILPAFILFALLKIKKGATASDVWIPTVFLSFVLFAGALLATNTGEAEEEIVESVVSEQVIHVHEENAEVFTWVAGIVFLITTMGFLSARFGQAARYLTAFGSIALLVLALRTGHSGGSLVYEHGAASAVRPASTSAWSALPASEHSEKSEAEQQ